MEKWEDIIQFNSFFLVEIFETFGEDKTYPTFYSGVMITWKNN